MWYAKLMYVFLGDSLQQIPTKKQQLYTAHVYYQNNECVFAKTLCIAGP